MCQQFEKGNPENILFYIFKNNITAKSKIKLKKDEI